MRFRSAFFITAMVVIAPMTARAGTQDLTAKGFFLPPDKAVSIVLMKPDANVGELQGGGLPQPNAEWTRQARDNLIAAFGDELAKRKIDFHLMEQALAQRTAAGNAATPACVASSDATAPAATPAAAAPAPCPAAPAGPDPELVAAQYTALHGAVVTAIIEHKYGLGGGGKLPTKKDDFLFTMGPGTAQLSKIGGGNYGLFVQTYDQFASASRKTMQVAGLLGCAIGFCVIVHGGVHTAYASLVDLDTGNVVWFNLVRGSQGDVRQAKGAHDLAAAILASLPTKPGEEIKTASLAN